MLQCALSNCVEQVRDIVGLFAHNNLILADKLVDISYRERSLKCVEIVNYDLLRIAVDSQLNTYVFYTFYVLILKWKNMFLNVFNSQVNVFTI